MILFTTPLMEADYLYKFQLAEVPTDRTGYRIGLEKLMMMFDARVKTITISESSDPKIDINYIVTVDVELDMKKVQSIYDDTPLPKAVITQIIATK